MQFDQVASDPFNEYTDNPLWRSRPPPPPPTAHRGAPHKRAAASGVQVRCALIVK